MPLVLGEEVGLPYVGPIHDRFIRQLADPVWDDAAAMAVSLRTCIKQTTRTEV